MRASTCSCPSRSKRRRASRNGSLDWVFIDANHTYDAVLADILAWSPKLKASGLLSGHDFGLAGVAEAVLRAFGHVNTGPASIWMTRSRPRSRAVIAARRLAHESSGA